uniref:HTH tetR-type domain-containing protein n=1 Tax=uncultured bacterium Contig1522a TaxID=1393448 RepID=W0FKG6_9BACT|nr:hypothetical protein [uncultured bacterium Contig1522a]
MDRIEKKEMSRRQRMTIRLLEEAYLELLDEEGEVTVAALCERADVNRTTFYRYFSDMEAFAEETRSALFSKFFSLLDGIELDTPAFSRDLSRRKILEALQITEKNEKLCRILLVDGSSDLAVRSLEEHLTLLRDTARAGCGEEEADLCYAAICGAIARLWVRWIDGRFSVPKEKMVLLIEGLLLRFYDLVGSGILKTGE